MDIIPGLLEKDTNVLKKKIDLVKSLAKKIHIDIVDKQFADNLTIGIDDIRGLDSAPPVFLHLMVKKIDQFLPSWCQTPSAGLIFYPRESTDLSQAIKLVKSSGKQVVLALDKKDPVDLVSDRLDSIDAVLVLAVEAGFAGAEFDEAPLVKIGQMRSLKPDLVVGVDGGVNKNNIKIVQRAGASFVVVNSAIFASPNPVLALEDLNRQIS